MKEKIYLAGPVVNISKQEAEENFAKAEKVARELGFDPVNPLKLVPPYLSDLERESSSARRMILQIVLGAMLGCNNVMFLYDHEKSSGSRIEHKIAEEEYYKCFYLNSDNTAVHFIKRYEPRNQSTVTA